METIRIISDKFQFVEQNMKKHLANIITGLRIIGSVALLFLDVPSFPFYITYLLCGFTDMIDGAIARKTNAVSSFGSKLDTVADIVFMMVCAVKVLPTINLPVLLLIWIAVIAIIKFANIFMEFVRRRKLVDYHTVLNKITGFLLFILPFTLQFIKPTYSLAVVCVVATVAAIQEGYYTIEAKDK